MEKHLYAPDSSQTPAATVSLSPDPEDGPTVWL